ncbi:MAG: FHA domain-containing protein [Nitrolancea sp.]
MSGHTVLTIFVFLGVIVWAGELVWLYRRAQLEENDPLGYVSGAAFFFVLAVPVALYAPDVIDVMDGFWERLVRFDFIPKGEDNTPRLIVAGKSVSLNQQRVRIGRYPNNDVVLDHPTVSAYHAEVTLRPDGRHELVDRESRNGTRINGSPVRSAILRDGDQITLGAITLHYLVRPTSERQIQAGLPYSTRR